MKKKVLILCNSNPDTDPRPNRMIHYLKDKYQVTVLGRDEVRIEGVESLNFFDPTEKRMDSSRRARLLRLPKKLLQGVVRIVKLILKRYEDIVWSSLGEARTILKEPALRGYDLILSHDILLMPLACRLVVSGRTKLMLDAREFYPKAFDDQWRWRWTVKPVSEYLCQQYLSPCDKIITVSPGLAQEYRREYQVHPEIVMSLPAFWELAPAAVNTNQIRMIYHGLANASRRTEALIELMDYLDERFSLDLMLVARNDSYYYKMVSMAKQRKNVRVIPPVRMQEIVPFTNQYDVGLILYPPVNFNVVHALPNKLFEFIQARLAVAIGPGVEMRKIVEKYDCGIVSGDSSPLTLAQELNKLTAEKIIKYKRNSDAAAHELNADVNKEHVLNIVQGLIGE
jgi:hypothetical protein